MHTWADTGNAVKRTLLFTSLLSLIINAAAPQVAAPADAPSGIHAAAQRDPLAGQMAPGNAPTRLQPDLGLWDQRSGDQRQSALDWDSGAGKSYLIPALEVPAFLILLNGVDRIIYPDKRTPEGRKTYSTTPSTIWDHLRHQNWKYDRDKFEVNQFSHPYQGATMYGLARSTGLGFWESFGYSNVGSFLWEMAGETSRPSANDMITTGTAGSLLGEALFRISSLMLSHENDNPGTWRKVGAAVVSPTHAFNRYAFGDRFKTPFPDHSPATFWQASLGESLDLRFNRSGGDSLREFTAADFRVSYGLPGKAGYSYHRPLDYFDLRVTALADTDNPLESILLRGLLYGKEYEGGDSYRGIWGLYGSYDYFAPVAFRVSTTSVSAGTTGQLWLAPEIALQGSLLGGFGFGVGGKTPVPAGERDYHYGLTPQGLLELRLLFADRAMMNLAAREYYISDVGANSSRGTERVFRGDIGATIRVWRRHGIGVQYVASLRHAHYRADDNSQTEGTISLFYTFLSDRRFGAVEWRDPDQR